MVELRPHQEKALKELGNGKILCGGVGSGKSLTAAAYYVANETPRDIYVITTAKKRDSLDWEKEFSNFAIGKSKDATVAGVLKVDSWNNIGNYTSVHGAFFIFDEQRVVGSGAWVKAFQHIAKSNRWIMLSATPGDTWLDYIPVFIANGFYKHRTAFLAEHVVFSRYAKFPKVERYIGVGKLVRYRNQILVDMPFDRHTVRLIENVKVDYNAEDLERVTNDRWNIFKNKPLRDIAELFGVARKVVNTHQTRLSSVQQLVQKHPRLIVFYNFDYELDILRTLLDPSTSQHPIGSNGGSNTQHAVDDFIRYLEEAKPEWPAPVKTEWPTKPFPDDETSQLNDRLVYAGTKFDNKSSMRLTPDGTSTNSPSSESVSHGRNQDTFHVSADSSTTVRMPKDGITSDSCQIAEWNGHKHEPIPETERWVYLVQYQAGNEGWNCIETDAMAFFSLNYSYKMFEQAQGRIDRLNTPYSFLYYYVLVSDSWIDKAIRKALREKRNFNEKAFSKKMGMTV